MRNISKISAVRIKSPQISLLFPAIAKQSMGKQNIFALNAAAQSIELDKSATCKINSFEQKIKNTLTDTWQKVSSNTTASIQSASSIASSTFSQIASGINSYLKPFSNLPPKIIWKNYFYWTLGASFLSPSFALIDLIPIALLHYNEAKNPQIQQNKELKEWVKKAKDPLLNLIKKIGPMFLANQADKEKATEELQKLKNQLQSHFVDTPELNCVYTLLTGISSLAITVITKPLGNNATQTTLAMASFFLLMKAANRHYQKFSDQITLYKDIKSLGDEFLKNPEQILLDLNKQIDEAPEGTNFYKENLVKNMGTESSALITNEG